MAESKQLTIKQYNFIEGIMQGLSGVQAAKQAGYKGAETTLAAVAYENLRKPQIEQAISERKAELQAQTGYDVNQWLTAALAARKEAAGAKQWGAVAAFDRLLAQHVGALEADNRQKAEVRQLSAKEQAEARAIAEIRLAQIVIREPKPPNGAGLEN